MKRWAVVRCRLRHGPALLAACDIANEAAPVPIELTLVDDRRSRLRRFRATIKRWSATSEGIFITYIHKSNDDYTAQQWRLAKSTDGGKSFATIHEATHATRRLRSKPTGMERFTWVTRTFSMEMPISSVS